MTFTHYAGAKLAIYSWDAFVAEKARGMVLR